MMTWRSMMGGRVLKGLWHLSAAFYLRVIPREENEPPEIRIGRTQNLLWDYDGTRDMGDPAQARGRIRGDVSTIEEEREDGPPRDRLRMALYDAPVGVQRREFYRSTTPKEKGFIYAPDVDQVHVATGASIITRGNMGYFHRVSDGSIFGYAADPLPYPDGYAQFAPNADAMKLIYRADAGPLAYRYAIATTSNAFFAPAMAASAAERAGIMGFTGNGQPGLIAIGGAPVQGDVVSSRPVGHIGQDHVVWQQAVVENLGNPNPESGYSQQDGYMKLTDEDGSNVRYVRIPFNRYANWRQGVYPLTLWSARIYRVDIAESQGGNAQANRSLIGRIVNKWETVPGTEEGAMVYEYKYVEASGQYEYVVTEEEVEEQFEPKLDEEDEPPMGGSLTAVMARLDGTPVEWTLPFDYVPRQAGLVMDYDVPGSLIEIDPTLWIAATRYSAFGIDQRSMYSRDQGATWYLIDVAFTNGNAGGATAVQMDMLLTSGAYGHAMKDEKELVPAAQ